MGILGFLFGDNKPLLSNAINEAMNNDKKCIEIFINELKQKYFNDTNVIIGLDKQFELLENLRKIRKNHSKFIEVEKVSSREMYQTLLLLKAKNAEYNGQTDTATGKIDNFEITLIRTTQYGGVFVNVIALMNGTNIIQNFIKSLNHQNQENIKVVKAENLSMDTINKAISILEDNYKKCLLELEISLQQNKSLKPEKYSDRLSEMTNQNRENIKINIRFYEIVNFFKENCEFQQSHPNGSVAEGSFFSSAINDYVYIIAERNNKNDNEYFIYSEYRHMYSICERIINQQ